LLQRRGLATCHGTRSHAELDITGGGEDRAVEYAMIAKKRGGFLTNVRLEHDAWGGPRGRGRRRGGRRAEQGMRPGLCSRRDLLLDSVRGEPVTFALER